MSVSASTQSSVSWVKTASSRIQSRISGATDLVWSIIASTVPSAAARRWESASGSGSPRSTRISAALAS